MHKFCKKCSAETERYADGRCKACTLRRNAEWAKTNRAAKNELSKKWNALNAHKKRALNEAYRMANRDEINRRRKEKRLQDPTKDRLKTAKRRALKRGSGGVLSKDIVQQLLKKQQGLCACCQQPLNGSFHLDHIVALSVGGKNDDANVQLLLPRCNLQKYTSTPENFLARRRQERLPHM